MFAPKMVSLFLMLLLPPDFYEKTLLCHEADSAMLFLRLCSSFPTLTVAVLSPEYTSVTQIGKKQTNNTARTLSGCPVDQDLLYWGYPSTTWL